MGFTSILLPQMPNSLDVLVDRIQTRVIKSQHCVGEERGGERKREKPIIEMSYPLFPGGRWIAKIGNTYSVSRGLAVASNAVKPWLNITEQNS
ncbi:hypothetical protein EDS67_25675 [candidate division KSB1 bacterium]|nr:MAG: hypothetical protein EDS67_25675 [candidate division KSB1 bacterium]MBC6947137.1 hypothetical protein [candidate division KSB1 bacterium]MCE7944784.1 hypothetical protein [Chlorobi bacterium CHB1]